jgi:hypothetical protein
MSNKSTPTEAEYEAVTNSRQPRSADKNAPDPLSLPNIAELIEHGQIAIGTFPGVGCAAVASGKFNAASGRHKTLSVLARRKGETLAQLLTRLELAVAMALEDKIFTDEVNLSRST